MTLEKIRELIKKVKALADKGVGGESISAKEKLKTLCEKYGLDQKELDDIDEKKDYFFILRDNNEKELLKNLICMILDVPGFKWKENKFLIKINLTSSQYFDINNAFEYYQRMYDDYKRYLIQGILARNSIGYIPKQQTYTQENVNSFDDPINKDVKQDNQDSQDKQNEHSEDTGSFSKNESNKKKKKKKERFNIEEEPIDPIKLMKVAVALDRKPWTKTDPNKKLIEEDVDDII